MSIVDLIINGIHYEPVGWASHTKEIEWRNVLLDYFRPQFTTEKQLQDFMKTAWPTLKKYEQEYIDLYKKNPKKLADPQNIRAFLTQKAVSAYTSARLELNGIRTFSALFNEVNRFLLPSGVKITDSKDFIKRVIQQGYSIDPKDKNFIYRYENIVGFLAKYDRKAAEDFIKKYPPPEQPPTGTTSIPQQNVATTTVVVSVKFGTAMIRKEVMDEFRNLQKSIKEAGNDPKELKKALLKYLHFVDSKLGDIRSQMSGLRADSPEFQSLKEQEAAVISTYLDNMREINVQLNIEIGNMVSNKDVVAGNNALKYLIILEGLAKADDVTLQRMLDNPDSYRGALRELGVELKEGITVSDLRKAISEAMQNKLNVFLSKAKEAGVLESLDRGLLGEAIKGAYGNIPSDIWDMAIPQVQIQTVTNQSESRQTILDYSINFALKAPNAFTAIMEQINKEYEEAQMWRPLEERKEKARAELQKMYKRQAISNAELDVGLQLVEMIFDAAKSLQEKKARWATAAAVMSDAG